MHSLVRAIYWINARSDGPARARRIIRQEPSAVVPCGILADLTPMVSELVTNAVK
jgi:hypothetical protein